MHIFVVFLVMFGLLSFIVYRNIYIAIKKIKIQESTLETTFIKGVMRVLYPPDTMLSIYPPTRNHPEVTGVTLELRKNKMNLYFTQGSRRRRYNITGESYVKFYNRRKQ